jgi:hypothetical protein
VPQILFAGFFIKIEQIPVYLRPFQYLCSLKYALNLLMISEFTNCLPNKDIACRELLDTNDIYPDYWWAYFLVLCGLFLICRIGSFYFLSKRV